MAQKTKVPVTERAALQRINRVLKSTFRKVNKSRPGSGQEHNCGRFYEIDVHRNMVTNTFIDIDVYGRELKVLAEWEEVEK